LDMSRGEVHYFSDPHFGMVEKVEVLASCTARVLDLGNWHRGVAVMCSTSDGREYSGYVEYEYGAPHGELYAECFGEGDKCMPLIGRALRRGKVVAEAQLAYALRVVKPHGRGDYEAYYYPLPDHHVGLGLVKSRGREAHFAVRGPWPTEKLAEVADKLARELGDRAVADSVLHHVAGYRPAAEKKRRGRKKKTPA